jgi:hypothetical protein
MSIRGGTWVKPAAGSILWKSKGMPGSSKGAVNPRAIRQAVAVARSQGRHGMMVREGALRARNPNRSVNVKANKINDPGCPA